MSFVEKIADPGVSLVPGVCVHVRRRFEWHHE